MIGSRTPLPEAQKYKNICDVSILVVYTVTKLPLPFHFKFNSSYRTSASEGHEPRWQVWLGRAWESKPDPDARQARGESPNITIDLGAFFFLTTGRSVLGVKHNKKPSIWGPDLEQAQFGEFFAKNALANRGVIWKRPDSNKKRPDPTQNAPTRCPFDMLDRARAIIPEALNTQ